MNVILYVMTSKGLSFLKKYIEDSSKNILYVVSDKDTSINKDYFDEINNLCDTHSINFYRRNKAPKEISKSIIIAVSWRWIINCPNNKVIVIHDSILPKYRGFNPLVTALIKGDNEIGITAIYASSEYDRGEIIFQKKNKISYPITINQAINIIRLNYEECAKFISSELSSGSLPSGKPQSENESSYSLWRNEDDYLIDWGLSSNQILRFIDAVGFPYKGATSFVDGQKVRILKASEFKDVKIENRQSGKIIFINKGLPVVVCGKGLIIIEEIENEYGKSLLPLSRFRIHFKNH